LTWYFIFFFLSGFCSILYELIWLRLSMAQFGVTTAMVSIVLSIFMAGLGLGSWISGRWLNGNRLPALRLYALIELVIGGLGLAVPYALVWSGHTLQNTALHSSSGYYWLAGLLVALTLLPGCCLMGATLPVGMRAIGQTLPSESRRSFSYLYMANVAGAVAGTALPLFLIEWLGFRGTVRIGAACNGLIAISALALSRGPLTRRVSQKTSPVAVSTPPISNADGGGILALLFLSGLSSMAMEVIWVRQYTPFMGTVVYSFASILSVYLLATFVGSLIYRRWTSLEWRENPAIWSILAAAALLPLVLTNPDTQLSRLLRLVLGLSPFTGLLGFITPMLLDRFSAGNSSKAGIAYAVNIAGCILGPLLAGFMLLPFMAGRWALIGLTAPWLVIGLAQLFPARNKAASIRVPIFVSTALAFVVLTAGRGLDEETSDQKVLRDSTATVIASGTGMNKQLLINGYGITSLTPITKIMAHLPMAFLGHPPEKALVICFGMGTTFRSMRSWNVPVTVVELVPSVPRLFGFYHSNAEQIMNSPMSHVVIDDGRRYLERTRDQYDVITIDPPPPLSAASSSLLYSEDFYRAARRRLKPGGILQQWLPATADDDPVDTAAVTRSLRNSFPFVRAFANEFGVHFLCSERPIPVFTTEQIVTRMPTSALADLTEWAAPDSAGLSERASEQLDDLLKGELTLDSLIASSPDTPALTDDRPINEYYLVRKLRHDRHPQTD
jgi:predicted membrane-bound spermidine synthase